MAEKLIYSFEGLDGAGKTTMIGSLRDYYENMGYLVATMKSPSNSPFGQYIRRNMSNFDDWLKNQIFALDLEHNTRTIPVNSDIVFWDRHIDSIYSSNMGCTMKEYNELAGRLSLPMTTLYLDLTPEQALHRALAISDHPLDINWLRFKNLRYKELIDLYPERFCVINAAGSLDDVFDKLTTKINGDLKGISK